MQSLLDPTEAAPSLLPTSEVRSLAALGRIANANELLDKVGADSLLRLLQRLGFWAGWGDGNPLGGQTKKFRVDLSKLESGQLGDEAAYWQSELSRAIAVAGALQAQRMISNMNVKRAKDAAAAAVLREREQASKQPVPEGEVPVKQERLTGALLASLVAERPEVVDEENKLLLLDVVLASLDAVKEAIEGYCRVLSREISRRGDLMRAGLVR